MSTLALAGCVQGGSGLDAFTGAPAPVTTEPATQGGAGASPTASAPAPAESPATSSSPLPPGGDVLIITAQAQGASLQVSAMVSGVSESDGTCLLTVIGTGESTSAPANAGNGVTYCGLMTVTPSDRDSTQWRFQVGYESPRTTAASVVSTLESTR